MRYFFTLPRSFDPLEFLTTPRLQMRADDARWLMDTIVRKTAYRNTDPWGCVRLHSSIMRKIMSPDNIAGIVKALERGKAIETAPYFAGVKCKGYRLGRRYLGDRRVCRPATGSSSGALSRKTGPPKIRFGADQLSCRCCCRVSAQATT